MSLAAYTDDQVRDLRDHGTTDRIRALALEELAKRGLDWTPEQQAKLLKDRARYNYLARDARGDWGYSG